jgi:hypothetical protein
LNRHLLFQSYQSFGFLGIDATEPNLYKYYLSADNEGKRLIVGLMFPQKFVFKNEQLQTSQVDETF